jgi:hypothetical protein
LDQRGRQEIDVHRDRLASGSYQEPPNYLRLIKTERLAQAIGSYTITTYTKNTQSALGRVFQIDRWHF